jgi:hypothetical protein
VTRIAKGEGRVEPPPSETGGLGPAELPRGETGPRAFRQALVDVIVLVAAKALVGAFVLRCGFAQVSDDDYARTVIAEQFAHAPRLDPSATSWLPLPFWIAGSAMLVLGRSLSSARAIAFALGALSVAAPYAAMRAMGMARASAWVATAIAMALPWNAWLAVAPVPEGWEGAVGAAAMIAMGDRAARPWCALALLAASLSRYEAWPVCAVLALACVLDAVRERLRSGLDAAGFVFARVAVAVVAVAGPVAWMAWNAHAHGSPTHFVTRVANFRRAIGAADIPLADKLLGYPRALLFETPEVAAFGLLGIAGMVMAPALRRRWVWPAAAAAAVLVFLVVGDVRDGAPTHHPERALSLAWWVLVAMGTDAVAYAVAAARPPARRAAAFGIAGAALAWCATLPGRWRAVPGATDAERRDAQVAAGLALRAEGAESIDVTPCAYEHFALLAAWGSPERARIHPATHAAITRDCPRVERVTPQAPRE